MVIFGGYVKVRESLYTWEIIWVNTFLNHIDTRGDSPQSEGQTLIPTWYEKKKKKWNPHYRYPNGTKKKSIPDQHWFVCMYISGYYVMFKPMKKYNRLLNWAEVQNEDSGH